MNQVPSFYWQKNMVRRKLDIYISYYKHRRQVTVWNKINYAGKVNCFEEQLSPKQKA